MRGVSHQRGIAAAALIVAIVLIGAAVLVARYMSRSDVSATDEAGTKATLERAAEALIQFASLNRRLPCPAVGTDDAGLAAPTTASATCAADAGVLPWQTLGLRREDAIDGWGRKISYRVYSGTTGLTQAEGASATNCNTALGSSLGPLDAGNKCRASHVNVYTDFTSGKGLTLTDDGVAKSGLAYVLISHGETGYGAYAAEGTGRAILPTAGGREVLNTGTATPFHAGPRSATSLTATDAAHFDDLVLYRTIDEVISKSSLTARSYAGVTVESVGTVSSTTFSRANIDAAVAGSIGNNTGQTTIDFGNFTVTASVSGRNISSGVLGTGEGIGSILSGSSTSSATTMSSGANETLRFNFDIQARSLGITISDVSRSSASNAERVRFTFYLAGTSIYTVLKAACTNGNVQANWSLDPGGMFDRFDVTSVNTAGGGTSTILIGSFRTCNADITPSLCRAPTAVVANDCS